MLFRAEEAAIGLDRLKLVDIDIRGGGDRSAEPSFRQHLTRGVSLGDGGGAQVNAAPVARSVHRRRDASEQDVFSAVHGGVLPAVLVFLD